MNTYLSNLPWTNFKYHSNARLSWQSYFSQGEIIYMIASDYQGSGEFYQNPAIFKALETSAPLDISRDVQFFTGNLKGQKILSLGTWKDEDFSILIMITGLEQTGQGVEFLYMDYFLGAPSVMAVGGGIQLEPFYGTNLDLETAKQVHLFQYLEDGTIVTKRLNDSVPMYGPHLQQLDGKLILADGGFVSFMHLIECAN